MSLRWILSFAWPWRWTLALCSLLMLAESAVGLAVPWLAGRYAGGLLASTSAAMGGLLLTMVLLLAAQAVLRFASGWMSGRTAEAILASLRVRLYDHLQALPLGWFQQRRHGDVVALLTYDVERLSVYLSGTLTNLLPLMVSLVGALVMMARIDARLTLLVLATMPVFYLVMKLMGRRLRPLSSQLQQAYADAMAVAEENLQMLPAIKTFTREPLESARYGEQVQRIFRLGNQERLIYAAMGPTVQFLAAAGMVVVLWLLGSGQGRSPAEMVSFLLYAAYLTRPVGSLANVYGQTRQAKGALQRLREVLQEPVEPTAADGTALPPARGEIEFRDVSFAYPDRGATLQGLNLTVAAGETVALTGVNGAGKSTLV
ncbi:MAG: ATP-binding cassette domain-containing protein, partial [Hydrogenophaga sp.]|nr:ATP-binding cassette domain-containing protein [Hydrogenophaga sp.]